MGFSLDEIEEAKTDTEHRVEIPFGSNGSGKVLEIFYRPLTQEILGLPPAEAIAAFVIRWNAEEEPTAENLRKRPMPFLNRVVEGVVGDFFPAKKK